MPPINPNGPSRLSSPNSTLIQPKLLTLSPEIEHARNEKEVNSNVNIVNSGQKDSMDVNFDRMNLMKFDENGRLVPKFSQDVHDARNKLGHATVLEPKLTNLVIKGTSSPEKLNLKSKISIFEVDEKSVDMKPDSNLNPSITIAKDPHRYRERSASFTTLVEHTNPRISNLSRKLSTSDGASLVQKTRKESTSVSTPPNPTRKCLRKDKVSQSFDVDSPGKRKLSPESSNFDFQNRGSGKRTTRDR